MENIVAEGTSIAIARGHRCLDFRLVNSEAMVGEPGYRDPEKNIPKLISHKYNVNFGNR